MRLCLPRFAAFAFCLCSLSNVQSFAHIQLNSPNGGESFTGGQLVRIEWDAYIFHTPGTIGVELSTNNGVDYTTLFSGIPINSATEHLGSVVWTVPKISAALCRIRVTYYTDADYTDVSNGPFSISATPTQSSTFEQGTNSYNGTRDATLFEESTNSDGGGQHVFAGETSGQLGAMSRRALIAYDLSSLPAGSTILAVSLEMTISRSNSGATTQTLYRLTQDWGEGTVDAPDPEGKGAPSDPGDATWISRFAGTVDWATPGGEFSSTPSGSATADALDSTVTWADPQMVADVQSWVGSPGTNFGWILIGDESTLNSAKSYHSSEGQSGKCPRLTVTYLSPISGVNNWLRYR